jgi:Na+-transporting NADH:ubiquinone oxidoreductase subunit C
MALDANKNSYTFIFAFVMVVVVAAILSFAATSLKPAQAENIRLEKMQNILASINIEVDREGAGEAYGKYIKREVVLSSNKPVEGINAFQIDLSKEMSKTPLERDAPMYIAEKEGSTYYIIPLRGKGLWGPIWGYISLKEDVNTVYGATFDHKTETPGLGAEINTPMFMEQFQSKKILKDGQFSGIKVTKKEAAGDYEVDGISGGTITSDGVEDMITDCMQSYLVFLDTQRGTANTAALENRNANSLVTVQ